MRLFIAIPLPELVARRASTVLPEELSGLRRVSVENIHVTLAFLGETPPDRLPDVVAAAQEAARAVDHFALTLDRAGRFPERGRPRVVWLGIGRGSASVARLGEGLYQALRERALSFEDRPLAAHLTLARVRDDLSPADARALTAAIGRLAPPPLTLEVRHIAVVQSVLSPKGPRYTALAEAPLATHKERSEAVRER